MKQKPKAKSAQIELKAKKKTLSHSPVALGFSALAALTVLSACGMKRAPHSDGLVKRAMCESEKALNLDAIYDSRTDKLETHVVQTAIFSDQNILSFKREAVLENMASSDRIRFTKDCKTLTAQIFSPSRSEGQIVSIEEASLDSWTFKDGETIYKIKVASDATQVNLNQQDIQESIEGSVSEKFTNTDKNIIRFTESSVTNPLVNSIEINTHMSRSDIADTVRFQLIKDSQVLNSVGDKGWMTAAQLLEEFASEEVSPKKDIDSVEAPIEKSIEAPVVARDNSVTVHGEESEVPEDKSVASEEDSDKVVPEGSKEEPEVPEDKSVASEEDSDEKEEKSVASEKVSDKKEEKSVASEEVSDEKEEKSVASEEESSENFLQKGWDNLKKKVSSIFKNKKE